MRYFNSYKLLLLACLFWFFQSPALAEDALEDTNHVPTMLGDYGSVPKRLHTDVQGNLYVNTMAVGNCSYSKVVDTITLNNTTTTYTSAAVLSAEMTKVSFIIVYDETEVNKELSGKFTVEVSPDNVNWIDCDLLLDSNGVDNPQKILEYTVDSEDLCYFPYDFNVQWSRVTFIGTNTDATNTILINVWMCWQ
jgi:hypothetical protein